MLATPEFQNKWIQMVCVAWSLGIPEGKVTGTSPRPTPPHCDPGQRCQEAPYLVLHFAADLNEMMIIIDPTNYNSFPKSLGTVVQMCT